MPQNWLKKMAFHSEVCEKHTYIKDGQEVIKPIQMMIVNSEVLCPRCEAEKTEQQLQASIQSDYDKANEQRKYNTLYKRSIIQDNTLIKATLENYEAKAKEEIANKHTVLEAIDRMRSGQVFNVVLQGNQGAGKSHLAYAMLQELNGQDTSCLFVNVESMLRLIKDTFNNKESKYTENYFVELMSEVDYLTLDDIGAETGAIGTDKTATDFVQRVLYAITTTRQDKSTFITTNLSSETLFKMYDKKLVSRMFRNPKFVVFRETKDKRMNNIPF